MPWLKGRPHDKCCPLPRRLSRSCRRPSPTAASSTSTSQQRCVDFMIDAGSNGLCILANFSEQFVLSDDERELLTKTILEHVAGRVPVIVTTTHFSTRVCIERSRRAQALGAAMVMVMPPYHGATIRVPRAAIHAFYRARCRMRSRIPIMIQDAPVSGTPLSAAFLARMAQRDRARRLLQDRDAGRGLEAARADPRSAATAIEGPWDGEEGDHAAARPRRRRHRLDDRRRLSRRHPPHRRCLRGGPARRGDRRVHALAAADQLREPPVRPARRPRR